MINEVANKTIEMICERSKVTMTRKATEYASGGDRLWNFKRIGEFVDIIYGNWMLPAKYLGLIGLWLKHFVSMLDLTMRVARWQAGLQEGEHSPEVTRDAILDLLDEKSGDNINYQMLWELQLREDLNDDRWN